MSFHVRIEPSGHSFTCSGDTSLLEAARAQGLALPYSCLGGVCGSCKARLIDGEVRYPHQPPTALARSSEPGAILLCQAVAMSNLAIAAREVPTVADMPRRVLAVKLVARELVAPDVMLLRLKPPKGQTLRWLAGQYLDVLLPEGKRRSFSIANAPEHELDDHAVELHVRRVAGGGFTEHVFAGLEPGAVLRIEAPLGTFVPREDSDRPMIFMAGGTGFAPIKAIIEHFIALGTVRSMRFYWGARTIDDLYMDRLPRGWASAYAGFDYIPVLSLPPDGPAGFRVGLVHEAVLSDVPDLSGHDLYMSGPPGMIDAARDRFITHGLPEDRLFYDSFEYAPDVIAAILAKRAGVKLP